MKFAFRAFAGGESKMFEYDIEFVTGHCYRPELPQVNGEIASMELFFQKHGYNWKSGSDSNTLFYATESGKEYRFDQTKLIKFGQKNGVDV